MAKRQILLTLMGEPAIAGAMALGLKLKLPGRSVWPLRVDPRDRNDATLSLTQAQFDVLWSLTRRKFTTLMGDWAHESLRAALTPFAIQNSTCSPTCTSPRRTRAA